MKKFLTSLTFLALFGAYAADQYMSASAAPTGSETASAQTIGTASSQSTPPPDTSTVADATSGGTTPTQTTPKPVPTPTPTPVTKPKGQYTDGEYTGDSVYAYYGYVQVRATISGGKLTSVTFLQYPNDRNESRYINSQAMPLLKQEAIAAQSANVDGVSGASDTSAAFAQSLASALTQAKS